MFYRNSNRCCSTIAREGTIVVIGVTYESFNPHSDSVSLWKFNTSILLSYTFPAAYTARQGTYILGGLHSSSKGSLTSIPIATSFLAHGLDGSTVSTESPLFIRNASCTDDGVMTITFSGMSNYGVANTFFYNGNKVTITE